VLQTVEVRDLSLEIAWPVSLIGYELEKLKPG